MMDIGKFFTKRIVVGIIAGVFMGVLADELRWRQRQDAVMHQLSQVQASHAEETQRVTELQSRLAAAEAEMKRLREELEAEQSLRHKYEELVNRGRK
jgi:septal ring factor EnvC (AmiA/AmiB activator)